MLQKTLVILLLLAGVQTAVAQQQGGDPRYSEQWHLKNTGQNEGKRGEDINVEPVWNKYRGSTRTVIAIVDRDLQLDHPDLIENVSTQYSFDYHPGEVGTDSHATRVAGVAAARGYNDIGVRGVAPLATMYSLNLLAGSGVFSQNLIDALQRNRIITAVYNHSWSLPSFQPTGSAWEMAVKNAITEGFYGKGTVYVWSAGNGHCHFILHPDGKFSDGNENYIRVCGADSANYNSQANHHTSIAVCAVSYRGEHNGDSEFGANLWVCAMSRNDRNIFGFGVPAGIVTTSRPSTYTTVFGGTSAAAPMVSGVVALMREANPNLSWRDVKVILANSARQNDSGDDGWQQGSLKYGSFGGEDEQKYYFNHKYGFGVVNAQKAVELAENWTPLPARAADTVGEDIVSEPSLSRVIRRNLFIRSDISFIEYVDIPVTFRVNPVSDLSMKLISPSGTISNLMIPADRTIPGESLPLQEWRFGSARHLGENPSGTWKLELEMGRGGSVELTKWKLRLRGYQIKMDANAGPSDLKNNTIPVTLSLIGTKWKEDLRLGDFRLKNAPVGLNIINVARTSDTQVQLSLKSETSIPEDYLFQVVATTGTVSSFAKPLSSDNIGSASNERIVVRETLAIPNGAIGSNYFFTMEDFFISSQTLSYTISGDVPPGLEITSPVIRGKATEVGDYRFQVTATCCGGVSETVFFDFSILPYRFETQIKVLLESALAPHVDVCARTAQVRDKIVELTRSNGCASVPKNSLASITRIDLSQQGIVLLANGDFSGLDNLQVLDLRRNLNLSLLPSGIFDGLNNLTTLYLHECNLGTNLLSQDLFDSLAKLQRLVLSFNGFVRNPPTVTTFSGLSNLRYLNLGRNDLENAYCNNLEMQLTGISTSFTQLICS